MSDLISVNEPLVGDREIEYVTDALRTGWISSMGSYLDRFEKAFATECKRKHATTVNNGTNALILAMRALDLPPGSEVIMPSFTIISCAMACVYNDLVPVFVDADPDTWNMNLDQMEAALTPKTRAVMMVHIYGHPVDVDRVQTFCDKNKLTLVEDFAEAIGSEYKGKICGSFGRVSCASFYANKMISTGEGGMCLTDDDTLAARMRSLKNLAFGEPRYVHQELGYNYRMTNVQAAIGLAQTERIQQHIEKKVAIGRAYGERLKPLADAGVLSLPVEHSWAKNTYWMYGIFLNPQRGIEAGTTMTKLQDLGIQTRRFFYPMHQQPALKKYTWFKEQSLPVSESLFRHAFYIPSGLTLTPTQIDRVCDSVKKVLTT